MTTPKVVEVRTAPASLFPCIWYSVSGHGSSVPVRTQGHHIFPQYLQKELWGEVRREELAWSCGTCHDSIHSWIDHLLRGWRSEVPPYRLRREAERVAAWYYRELNTLTGL